MRSRRSLRVFLLAVLLCAVGVAVQQALTPPPDLAHLATRAPLQSALGPPTRLISTGESPFAVSPDGRLFRTDVSGQRMVAFGGPGNFVSPDGRWVLAVRLGLVIATDGSGRIISATNCVNGDKLWLPDSRRWIGLGFARGAVGLAATVHDVNNPNSTHDVPLGSPVGAFGFPDYVYAHMLGAVGPDRVLVKTSALSQEIGGPSWTRFLRAQLHLPHSRVRMHFFEFSVGGVPAVRQYTVTMPIGVTGADAALSRRGQLAWLRYYTTEEWHSRLTAVDLAVSRPDGSRMRIVGRLTVDPASAPAQDRSQWPDKLTWLPDGAHVRFVFKDMLWTIPIR